MSNASQAREVTNMPLTRGLILIAMPPKFTTAELRSKVGHVVEDVKYMVYMMHKAGFLHRSKVGSDYEYALSDKGRAYADRAWQLLVALDLVENNQYEPKLTELENVRGAVSTFIDIVRAGNMSDAALYDLEVAVWRR